MNTKINTMHALYSATALDRTMITYQLAPLDPKTGLKKNPVALKVYERFVPGKAQSGEASNAVVFANFLGESATAVRNAKDEGLVYPEPLLTITAAQIVKLFGDEAGTVSSKKVTEGLQDIVKVYPDLSDMKDYITTESGQKTNLKLG